MKLVNIFAANECDSNNVFFLEDISTLKKKLDNHKFDLQRCLSHVKTYCFFSIFAKTLTKGISLSSRS